MPEEPASTMWTKLRAFLRTEHVEVTTRLGIACCASYAIAVLDADVLNPFLRILLPVLVPFVAMLMPTLAFAYGAIILPMAVIFLLSYAAVTILLAVSAVWGSAAVCAVYGIIVLWLSFLRWDKATGPGTSIFIIAVTFVALLAHPNHLTVRNGVDVMVVTEYGSDGIDAVAATLFPNTIPALLYETFAGDLSDVLGDAGNGTLVTEGDIVTIPDDSGTDLAGLDVEILETGMMGDDAYAKIHVPGGLWMVRATWTATGVNNPLALFYNLFVMWGWLYACLLLVYVIPPVRTLRFALTKGMIPAALSDTATYLELHAKELLGDDKDKDGEPADAAPGPTKQQLGANQIRHANVLLGGDLAKYTAFEAKGCKTLFAPPLCVWLRLKTLSDAVLKSVLVSIGVEELLKGSDHEAFRSVITHHLRFTKVFRSCALALQTGNPMSIAQADDADACAYDPFRMQKYSGAVAEATKSYLLAMDGKVSNNESVNTMRTWWSARSEAKLIWLPVYTVYTAYLRGLGSVLVKLCQTSYWAGLKEPPYLDLQKLVWCVRYTIGFVLLLVATIYWHSFGESFSLTVSSDRNVFGSVYSELNGGWAMITYCFATTHTTEGSIKKGLLRALGVLTGGFAGWLGLLACEDGDRFNPYGIVVWLTVTTIGATYVATNRGFFARLGLSGDYAFGPIYFVITEVVVVMYCYVFFGPSGRNDVTVNRVVSNLVGIVFSMLLSVLPLGVWGGNPDHCRAIVKGLEVHTAEYLTLLLQSKGFASPSTLEQLSKELLATSQAHLDEGLAGHAMAKDLFEDASRLSKAPFLKTDPRLQLYLALIGRDVHIVPFVAVLCARILPHPAFRRLALDGGVRAKLEAFREAFRQGTHDVASPKDEQQNAHESRVLGVDLEDGDDLEAREAKLVVELLLRVLELLEQRCGSHHRALDSVKWGYAFQSALESEGRVVDCYS